VIVSISFLSGAVHDGDVIWAIIRSTSSKLNGHIATQTQPCSHNQEQLSRHVYKKANLDFNQTRFFDAHGTGTAVGYPAEITAIGERGAKCQDGIGVPSLSDL
jgi:acyl transferase domain-containing protein